MALWALAELQAHDALLVPLPARQAAASPPPLPTPPQQWVAWIEAWMERALAAAPAFSGPAAANSLWALGKLGERAPHCTHCQRAQAPLSICPFGSPVCSQRPCLFKPSSSLCKLCSASVHACPPPPAYASPLSVAARLCVPALSALISFPSSFSVLPPYLLF